MTHTDLIARLRTPPFGTETSERNLMSEAADALTAALERIEALEGALSRIDVGHGWAAQIARAALDATGKGER